MGSLVASPLVMLETGAEMRLIEKMNRESVDIESLMPHSAQKEWEKRNVKPPDVRDWHA